MARIARVVAAGLPHHVIQRGNRKQKVFFKEEDKRSYLMILRDQAEKFGLKFWAYCLMDNHVHLIVIPETEESLAQGIGETHRRYTRMINFREKWRGYLWQGRFQSYCLDERYVYAAIRYVERNPVRAGMVKRPEDYLWSSAIAHVRGESDTLLSHFYLLDEIKNWSEFLAKEDQEDLKVLRKHGATGRPLGDEDFLKNLGRKLGINLFKQKPGPKVRKGDN